MLHGPLFQRRGHPEIRGETVKRLLRVAWKEFLQIRADKMMVRLMIFPVLAQVFIVGYALTTEVRHTRIAVVDRSRSMESRALIDRFRQGDLFEFMGNLNDEEQARNLLDRGKIRMAIVIPQDFAQRMAEQDARVLFIADGQDANSATIATGYAKAVTVGWAMEGLKRQLRAKGIDIETLLPVRVETRILFNPRLKSSWYMIPALVVMLVTMITALLTGFSIVKERTSGTFEQLMVTPVRPLEVVLGKALPFAVVGFLEIAIFLLVATLWFNIPFRGNVATLFLFSGIYLFSSLGIGILTSTIARTPQQVLFLTWFILIFFILLGGFFIPIENMPGWVQKVSAINPVRYFMLVVRELFLKGAGLRELWPEGLKMLAIGVTVFGTALLAFRRKAG